MDHDHLLYVLEKVKTAYADCYGVFHTREGTDDHKACLQLERDGLIRKVGPEDGQHFMWAVSCS